MTVKLLLKRYFLHEYLGGKSCNTLPVSAEKKVKGKWIKIDFSFKYLKDIWRRNINIIYTFKWT